MFRFFFTLFIINLSISYAETGQKKNNEEIVFVIEKLNEKILDKEKIVIIELNDSRCPKGAQCVWPGNVVMKIKWGKETFSLTAPLDKPVEMKNYKVLSIEVNEQATQVTLKMNKRESDTTSR